MRERRDDMDGARLTALDSSDQVRAHRRTLLAAPRTVAHHSRKRTRRSPSKAAEESSGAGIVSERELADLERRYADGMTAVQIVEVFASRGIRFSEASFRKYVQLGLLPRSRRVGRKGKHRGSLGVYPAKSLRRINEIKRLMGDGFTIDEIQEQFLRFTDAVESVEEGLAELFEQLSEELDSPRFDSRARKSLVRELEEARKVADELMERVGGLSEKLSDRSSDSYSRGGAAGSAEELL